MNLAENSLESNAQVLFFKKLKIFKLRHVSSLVEPKKISTLSKLWGHMPTRKIYIMYETWPVSIFFGL